MSSGDSVITVLKSLRYKALLSKLALAAWRFFISFGYKCVLFLETENLIPDESKFGSWKVERGRLYLLQPLNSRPNTSPVPIGVHGLGVYKGRGGPMAGKRLFGHHTFALTSRLCRTVIFLDNHASLHRARYVPLKSLQETTSK